MNAESSLLNKIRLRKANLAVLGLGHIGLPAALLFARSGFNVTGVDVDAQKVETLRQGASYVQEPGLLQIIQQCLQNNTFRATTDVSGSIPSSDIVSICVPTPVENARPNLKYFETAFGSVKAGAHKGMLIVVESTLPPSTMSKFVVPELEHVRVQGGR